jgi:hypothetical protein
LNASSIECKKKEKLVGFSRWKPSVTNYTGIEVLPFLFSFSILLTMSVNKNRPGIINLNQLVTNIPVRRKLTDQDDREKFEWNQVRVLNIMLNLILCYV